MFLGCPLCFAGRLVCVCVRGYRYVRFGHIIIFFHTTIKMDHLVQRPRHLTPKTSNQTKTHSIRWLGRTLTYISTLKPRSLNKWNNPSPPSPSPLTKIADFGDTWCSQWMWNGATHYLRKPPPPPPPPPPRPTPSATVVCTTPEERPTSYPTPKTSITSDDHQTYPTKRHVPHWMIMIGTKSRYFIPTNHSSPI